MSRLLESQIARIEERAQRTLRDTCTRCWGRGAIILCVPNEEDAHLPEYNSTACPGCGMQLRFFRRVIGISEEEMFPEMVESDNNDESVE
ncbi:MAG TPA: hypothetical protein VGR22_08730 [Thermomicrobiales bacterium]|nr:hypothetical protein [Thermomicrobiales bacterium]